VKVALDTNVLVSGILFTGPPHEILLAWADGRFELVFASDTHEEYRRVSVRTTCSCVIFPMVQRSQPLQLISCVVYKKISSTANPNSARVQTLAADLSFATGIRCNN
jgi:predicted nucleic acid-binding protein